MFLEIRGCLSRIPFEVVTQVSILSGSDAVWLIGITLVLTRAARRVIHRRAGTRRPARAGQGRRVQHKLDGLSTEPRHSNDAIARWSDWSFRFALRLSPIVSNLNGRGPDDSHERPTPFERARINWWPGLAVDPPSARAVVANSIPAARRIRTCGTPA